ncbi:MAG: hypothetical protein COU28_03415 [Candidatus Magasanikbacteria bacterium CG10_big_fil_rev_8_21_14_0_10_36_16]|uniref:Uncharacterized protein n=1 Tax=Candidatus Magasanikbacteria bacterium CG10_big_fil_rev_8_21_14_0_10_36_16 TaxID=1974645 RepID=A0A2H0TY12_9BACT|nr:MAG: hypothetical protein COU28_03415 [Candidatus Magasanikbacteria bacterium CG10_big_fil_rev_8_21_14_0_10_36_16]
MNKLKIEIDNQKISIYLKKFLHKNYILKEEFYKKEILNISFFHRVMPSFQKTHTNTILIFSVKKENQQEKHFVLTPQYGETVFRDLKNYKYNISNEKEMGNIIKEAGNIQSNEKFYSKMTIFMIVSIILLGLFVTLFILFKQ